MKTLVIAVLLLAATIGLSFAETDRSNIEELVSKLATAQEQEEADEQGLMDNLDDDVDEQGFPLRDENAVKQVVPKKLKILKKLKNLKKLRNLIKLRIIKKLSGGKPKALSQGWPFG